MFRLGPCCKGDGRSRQGNRTVTVGRRDAADAATPFASNEVVSSKYTAWNFVPVNLFEQFRRAANFYFLVLAILQTILPDSPVSPTTSWLPLFFVIIVTAVKQAYEDYLRHRSDREINEKLFDVLHDGQFQEIRSEDIKVGDILRVEEDDSFPCDLVLLSAANDEGKCFITTANLDGETNLKTKISPRATRWCRSEQQLSGLRATIQCQQPDTDLYRFVGTLTRSDADADADDADVVESLNLDHVLLRGSRLKDTPYICGCVVYTGRDTKLALNSKLTTNKFSTVERSMNYYLLFFLIILVFEIGLCSALFYWFQPKLGDAGYIEDETPNLLNTSISFLVLFSYLIPISLYVTLELQKFLGSLFFGWDAELYCPLAEEPAVCNSSDLNEELGQVKILLTDKTGTLTENSMEFRQCSIAGWRYVERDGRLLSAVDESAREFEAVADPQPKVIEQFLETLALCHTVHVARADAGGGGGAEPPLRRRSTAASVRRSTLRKTPAANAAFESDAGDAYVYQASSPDEKALVEAACRLKVVYRGEESDVCRLMVAGEERRYRRLHVLEFDSRRKRMSVIYRSLQDDSVWLLCKGAESSIVPLCTHGPSDKTLEHIDAYALLGLRTLAVAVRRLSDAEYREIDTLLQTAGQALGDRDEVMGRAFDAVEKDMTLLGATGVEDQLQVGVEETLEALKAAGIKIWVLTGDKLETAVNIAYSCGHFKRAMELLELSHQTEEANTTGRVLTGFLEKLAANPGANVGLVVDGASLALALRDHAPLLAQVASRCVAVVCCRMSPLQKSEVVRLVKTFPGRPITAAIGDGANDVSMIQEAHIGLGIMGKEGRQAVRCSDFAFARFRFLRRVLLVHGHWYYWRVATLVQYFFYKNIAFSIPGLFFTFVSAYSAQPLYDGLFLASFNLVFTSLPILAFGLLDQDFSADRLLRELHLYRDFTDNALMNWKQIAKWSLTGLWHAAVVYFLGMLLALNEYDIGYGQTLDLVTLGTLTCQNITLVVTLKLLLEARHWNAIFIHLIVFSLLVLTDGVIGLYSSFYLEVLGNYDIQGTYAILRSSGLCWLVLLLVVVACLLPDVLYLVWHTYSSRKQGRLPKILWRKLKRTVPFPGMKTRSSVSLDSAAAPRVAVEDTRC